MYDSSIGVIERRGRGIRFSYDDTIVDNENVHALSISLPKRREPYANRQAGVFFRNLLPEQAYKRLVAAAAGTSSEDNLALLGAIGGECPGAVSIWPEGQSPREVDEYQPLTNADLQALFAGSGSGALGNAITRGRLSLPGVQEKIALLRTGDCVWMLPLYGAVTSHILKQPNEHFPDLLENELYCMALARDSGLAVPDSGLVSRDIRALWVERFDRTAADGSLKKPMRKLHQEDFCQVLKVEPDGKYENDGGPGIRACSEVILRYSGLPAKDLPSLVRWICFNYLIGNEDAHAKNLALLYADSGLCLTPHYDLACTEVYRGLEQMLAMKIGRAWDIRNVQKSDWKLLAGRVGLPWDRVRVILLELAESVSTAAAGVKRRCEEEIGEASVYSGISDIVERHARQLTREVIVR